MGNFQIMQIFVYFIWSFDIWKWKFYSSKFQQRQIRTGNPNTYGSGKEAMPLYRHFHHLDDLPDFSPVCTP